MDQTIIQCWQGCFCVPSRTRALSCHFRLPTAHSVSICIDFCYLFRKTGCESVRCWVSLCACLWIHPCFHSIVSLSLMWMCFCLCACLWLALYSNIFGKCSVRCSALNGLALIYELTNLFAFHFVLEPGIMQTRQCCKHPENHCWAHYAQSSCLSFLPLWFGCWFLRLHWSTGFMSESWTSMEISCSSSLVHSAGS